MCQYRFVFSESLDGVHYSRKNSVFSHPDRHAFQPAFSPFPLLFRVVCFDSAFIILVVAEDRRYRRDILADLVLQDH